jgi:thioredoxin-related protein
VMKAVTGRLSHKYPVLRSCISRTIDPALDAAIILVSILVIVAFIRAGYPGSSAGIDQPRRSGDKVGRKISLRGVDWSKSEQTLLMFLSTECGYCKKSESFYRRLSLEATNHQKVRLIALFPQRPETSKEYLDRAGITVDDLRQPVAGEELRVKGTPTLVLVDRHGVATHKWVGLLSPAEEAEVMSRLGVIPRSASAPD